MNWNRDFGMEYQGKALSGVRCLIACWRVEPSSARANRSLVMKTLAFPDGLRSHINF